jgi:hypothetical protein
MNNLKEKIIEILPSVIFDEDIDEIMEMIELHSEESFDAGRYEESMCGDYEYVWEGWKEWYDVEVKS